MSTTPTPPAATSVAVAPAPAPTAPAAPAHAAWPPLDAQLLADSAATFTWRLGNPQVLAITPDGTVLFRRTPARDFAADLFALDTHTGAVTTVATADDLLAGSNEALSAEQKARRERTRTVTRGIVDIDVSADGRVILVPLGGKLFTIDRTSGKRAAMDPHGDAIDPRISPDGTHVAFVRDGDLYLLSAGGAPQRLTHHPDGFEYGVAEFVAQEELDRRRGFWWSPDSKQIVFQRSDLRPVDTIYVADARHNDQPPTPFKYPRAGRPNAIVDLGVIDAHAGAQPKWLTWDGAAHGYLVDVSWRAKSPLTITASNREQTDVTVYAGDPSKPGGAMRPLIREHDDAWLNVEATSPHWLDDGSGFLWMTEASGTWVCELHAPDGKLVRALAAPGIAVRQLAGADRDGAIVLASADDIGDELWRLPFAGGPAVRLTELDAVVELASVDHGVITVDQGLRAGGRRAYAIAADGAHRELPSKREQPSLVPTTALETVTISGRTHHVAITRPRAFDPARKYPVLLAVYAGPHVMTISAARDKYVMDQWYADAGFIVVRSDGRGTPGRGRAWERAISGDLITIPLADQVDALHAVAAAHPELDLARVGVFGWSFGGYFSTLAVLLRPDVFAAAVAGAPVTDWSFYDTAYTERYMRTPATNADGYARASALTHAAKLARPLLVIHGITDDNVHFANTLALIESLYLAGKRAEVITLSATHMVPDPKLNLAREQQIISFFRDHL